MPADSPRQYAGLMTLPEVAARTGRNVVDLRRWCRDGRLPAVKIGNVWVVDARDLAALDAIQDRQRRP